MSNEINKWIDLNNLPRKGSLGKFIDWKNSIGCKCKFVYDDIEGEIEIYNYENKNVSIKYNNYYCTLNISKLKRCQLGKVLNKWTGEFKVEIGRIFKDEKRNITIIDREIKKDKNGQNCKYYKYKCNIDGNEDWMIESSLLSRRTGCNVCGGYKILKFVNDIASTNPWMMNYLVNKEDGYRYGCSSSVFVEVKCPDCGFVKTMWLPNLYQHGFSCNKCGENIKYPNRFMLHMLEELNIEFVIEYSSNWANRRRFDFYIPSLNLIIEMDGGWHNNDNHMSGQTAEESKEIDNWKDEQAKLHGIEVIRIDCDYSNMNKRFKIIKENIMSSQLINYFNLNCVKWANIRDDLMKYESDKLFSNIKCIMNDFDVDALRLVEYINKGIDNGLL